MAGLHSAEQALGSQFKDAGIPSSTAGFHSSRKVLGSQAGEVVPLLPQLNLHAPPFAMPTNSTINLSKTEQTLGSQTGQLRPPIPSTDCPRISHVFGCQTLKTVPPLPWQT